MNKTVNWLDFAEEDLLWAKASLDDKIYRGACFAAQQAAEKALKAYLNAKGVRIFKIHDLVALNQACVKQDSNFAKLEEACNLISPYYLSTRYPDVAQFEEYSEKQAQGVIKQADKIVKFVRSSLVQNYI